MIVERCQIPISTVVARKQTLVDAGLFDEKLARRDDYDMWVRSAFSGAKIGYGRTVQSRLFTGRPGCLGQSRAKMAEGYWSILEKLRRTLTLQDANRTLLDKRAAEIRARYLLEEGKCKLEERQFDKARELVSEANCHWNRSTLSLAIWGLSIAPSTTTRCTSFWSRIRQSIRGVSIAVFAP